MNGSQSQIGNSFAQIIKNIFTVVMTCFSRIIPAGISINNVYKAISVYLRACYNANRGDSG